MSLRPKVVQSLFGNLLFALLLLSAIHLLFSSSSNHDRRKDLPTPKVALVRHKAPKLHFKKPKYVSHRRHSAVARASLSAHARAQQVRSSVLLELNGGIATHGEYYVEVDLGGSKVETQRVRVQVDTGSSSFIVSAKECTTCANGRGGRYSSALSRYASAIPCRSHECQPYTCAHPQCKSSNHGDTCFSLKDACCSIQDPGSCGFFLEYGGNTEYHVSASGTLVHEMAALSGSGQARVEANITLYDVKQQEGDWPSNVDGIFGLAFPRLNCNPTCSPMAFEVPVFSLCMGDHRGLLLLGGDGSGEHMFVGPVHYVPILAGVMPSYYIVKLDSVNVDQTRLGDPGLPHHAIVDSGTTLLLLQEDLWVEFVSVMQSQLCWLPGVCTVEEQSIFTPGICLSSLPNKRLPTISLSISGLILQLPPSAYFIKYKTGGQSAYCLGIQSAGAERTVIGDTFLRLYHVVHDKENMRLGFALANSTTCGALDISSHTLRIDQTPARGASAQLNKFLLFSGGSLFLCGLLSCVVVLLHSYRLLSQVNT